MMSRELHRPFVDVFPNSTTFDTARARAGHAAPFRPLLLALPL